MSFQANKTRGRRPAPPVGRGNPINPSAAIAEKYSREIRKLVRAMISDYEEKLSEAYEQPVVKSVFTHDSATTTLDAVVKSLQQRWGNIFKAFADKVAAPFVHETAEAADKATLHSLSVAGLKSPVATYNENVKRVLDTEVTFNHTLIVGITEDAHERVHKAVLLSLTSPNPDEQGFKAIKSAVREIGISCEKRANLIARDQTSKIYSAVSDERMIENGVEEFEWLHSSAGKVPRKSHLEKNGQIFKINDPRLWQGPKADQGPPGWAINCRCRKIPVIR